MFLAYFLNDIRKIIIHLLKHGLKAWTDPVAASEMTLYCHSLISPYYLWQMKLAQTKSSYIHPSARSVTSTDNLPT